MTSCTTSNKITGADLKTLVLKIEKRKKENKKI